MITISNLCGILNYIKAEHGDIPVVLQDDLLADTDIKVVPSWRKVADIASYHYDPREEMTVLKLSQC